MRRLKRMTEHSPAVAPDRSIADGAPPAQPPRGRLSVLLREPLVHFVLLGAGLFLLHARLSGTAAPDAGQIVVSPGTVEHLAALFSRTWRRPPTRQELEGLVADYVREEVAYREGLKLGLDQDDTIIRRRIRQKLDFVADDLATPTEATDAELAAYLAEHADAYRLDANISFRHVFLDPARHGGNVTDEAARLLQTLRAAPSAAWPELGDRTLLEPQYEQVARRIVVEVFGEQFAATLFSIETRTWQGPVASQYGEHLVFVDAMAPGRMPDLAEVRDAVRRDWEHQRRAELTEKFYQGLLDRYDVVVQWPAEAQEGP